jgi:hypothetical protein
MRVENIPEVELEELALLHGPLDGVFFNLSVLFYTWRQHSIIPIFEILI